MWGMKQAALKYYQLFPLVQNGIVLRQLSKARAFGACVLFDLEDSVIDPAHPEATSALKQTARAQLRELGTMVNEGGMSEKDFHIRINPLHSKELTYDLEALAAADITWAGIFVPCVSTPAHIELYMARLERAGIRYTELIPILETEEGLRNVSTIFANRPPEIQAAFFGNYDYHLDIKRFPIAEQHNDAYWHTVEPLIEQLEKLGVAYGNSPYTRFKDDPAFLNVLERMATTCSLPFRQITLRLQQSNLCRSFGVSAQQFMARQLLQPMAELMPLDEAQAIVAEFEKQRSRSGRQQGGSVRYITPQEYLLARNQLKLHDTASGSSE